jgi:hypothetical protein
MSSGKNTTGVILVVNLLENMGETSILRMRIYCSVANLL